MVDYASLKAGDRLVVQWGVLAERLSLFGQTVTVLDIVLGPATHTPMILICEDAETGGVALGRDGEHHWYWSDFDFDYAFAEEEPDVVAQDEDLIRLIGG